MLSVVPLAVLISSIIIMSVATYVRKIETELEC